MKKLCLLVLLSALSVPALAAMPTQVMPASTNSLNNNHFLIQTTLGNKSWNPGGF